MLYNRGKLPYNRTLGAKILDSRKFSVLTRLVILLFIASFLVIAINHSGGTTMVVEASTQSELEAKNNALKEEAKKYQREIDAQEADLKDQEAYINSINKKIAVVEKRIGLLDGEIRTIESNIAKLEKDIAAKEADIVLKEEDVNERFEILRQRLRAVSKTGAASTLQIVLDSDSYKHYLINSKIAERIAQKDNEAIKAVEAEIVAVNAEKEELNKTKTKLGDDKASAQKLRNEAGSEKSGLEVLYAKSNTAVKNAAKTLKSVQDKLSKNKKEREQLERDIQKLINDTINSGGGYNGSFGSGTMLWPVPTIHQISSYYGPRWGTMHRGIDISNGRAYGENIIATADGKVTRAQVANTWGGGYGYHIIIDHGNNSAGVNISTLYAHCSAVLVSVGQQVKAGQVIGRIGSTGDSTGPHLHYEVRENGTAVNPISKGYIKG